MPSKCGLLVTLAPPVLAEVFLPDEAAARARGSLEMLLCWYRALLDFIPRSPLVYRVRNSAKPAQLCSQLTQRFSLLVNY
jgi:hypothetical protein